MTETYTPEPEPRMTLLIGVSRHGARRSDPCEGEPLKQRLGVEDVIDAASHERRRWKCAKCGAGRRRGDVVRRRAPRSDHDQADAAQERVSSNPPQAQ